jgi:hypothetical protein
MSRVPNAPPEDIFTINLALLRSFLVDLPPGAMHGMRRQQEGWEDVGYEITSNQATYGERAGITATDFNKFVALNSQYAQILAELPRVEKAVEVLTESVAHADNLRHRLITTFANSAEAHARAEGGDPTLLTAYEKTIAYRGVIADKAAKTRKKNEEAKKAQGDTAGESGPTEDPLPAGEPTPAGETADTDKAAPILSRAPNAPPESIFTIDLTPFKSFLVDLPPGAMKGMRREQDGIASVIHEIESNQATYGERAGITATDFNKFVALNTQVAQLLAELPRMEKAVEVLTESLAHVDNLRHRLATTFANSVEAHANAEGGDPTLPTAYEKTITYRGVIADKSAKTRKKNEEAKAAQGSGLGAGRAL